MRFDDRMMGSVGVRLADNEKRELEDLARRQGVTLSALIRERLALSLPRRAAA